MSPSRKPRIVSAARIGGSASVPWQQVDRGQESIDRRIIFGQADLIPHVPVTEQHVGGAGMAPGALGAATLKTGDNAAAKRGWRASP